MPPRAQVVQFACGQEVEQVAFRAWLQGGHGPARRQQLQRGFRCWECWARARLHHLAIVRWQFERLSGHGPGGALAAPGTSPRGRLAHAGEVPYDVWTKQKRARPNSETDIAAVFCKVHRAIAWCVR